MTSFHNMPISSEPLSPSNANLAARRAIAAALPQVDPALLAQHVDRNERAGVPLVANVVAQIAADVQREYVQQQAANEAAHRARTRRYDLP